jgi:hypothetical protein
MKKETKFQFSPRPFSRLVTVLGCLAAAMTFVASNSLAQQSFLTYSANAYGTYAFLGSTVVVGKTAPVGVGPGCGTPQVGLTVTGTVASLTAPPNAVTGSVNTSASTALNKATGISDVRQLSLLGGMISGSEVKGVSITFKDNTGIHTSTAGSDWNNLIVAGMPMGSVNSIAPNTTINLLGVGKVVLNEQIVTGTSSTKGLTVNMIHVYVTQSNVLGIAVGTQIIVADAHSGLTQVGGPGTLDGTAFGTQVTGTLIKSSATAPVSVGCQGNSLITASQLGINLPLNLLSTGTISDTAQGSVAPGNSSSQTTASIQTANLLNGIIQASVIHAQANASTTNGMTFNFSTSGSSFGSLSVSGFPGITASVSANTQVTLPGIGTLYLKRVIQTSNSIQIRMIELVLTSSYMGLPTGTHVIVGSASASLHSPAHP